MHTRTRRAKGLEGPSERFSPWIFPARQPRQNEPATMRPPPAAESDAAMAVALPHTEGLDDLCVQTAMSTVATETTGQATPKALPASNGLGSPGIPPACPTGAIGRLEYGEPRSELSRVPQPKSSARRRRKIRRATTSRSPVTAGCPPAAMDPVRDSIVHVNFVFRPPPQHLRLPPCHHLGKLRALHEPIKILFRLPLRQNHIRPHRGHILVHMRFHMPGQRLEMLQHPQKAPLKFLFLAGNHVVMHADGRHGRRRLPQQYLPPKHRSHPLRQLIEPIQPQLL